MERKLFKYATSQQDIAQAVLLNTLLHKAKAVFFCGSFCGLSQGVRDEVSKNFMSRAAVHSTVRLMW